jgi:cytochrome c5
LLRPSTRLLAQEPSPDLADAPGKDVVMTVCSECHEVAPKIAKLRKSRTEWADLITDMQNRGMMADDKDLEVVLNYLTVNYGRPPDQNETK